MAATVTPTQMRTLEQIAAVEVFTQTPGISWPTITALGKLGLVTTGEGSRNHALTMLTREGREFLAANGTQELGYRAVLLSDNLAVDHNRHTNWSDDLGQAMNGINLFLDGRVVAVWIDIALTDAHDRAPDIMFVRNRFSPNQIGGAAILTLHPDYIGHLQPIAPFDAETR